MSPYNLICTSYDEFLQDKDETVLIVELDDGTTVYCDDGRYGALDKAWNRLREYLKTGCPKNDILSSRHPVINKISIRFRSHTEIVAEKTPYTIGWYFGRAAGCWIGCPTVTYMIVGTVEERNNTVFVKTTKWRVPEIIKDVEEERDPANYPDNIIWNN